MDHPDGLAATLRSLDAQTFPPSDYEVIVVDNGSGEDALRVVEQSCTSRSNVRLLIERAIRSSYAARNRGIAKATAAARPACRMARSTPDAKRTAATA